MITNKSSNFLRGIGILIVMASHYAGGMYVEAVLPALRDNISTWGPYGVDIFFLLSGYGLYKTAAKKEGVGAIFVLKRLLGVYLPYILLVLAIHAIGGTLANYNASSWKNLFTGYDFWYMNVLFIFYILFIIIWQMKEALRLPFITMGVIATMVVLSNLGRADFWIISNQAFLIGIFAAAAEKKWKKGFDSRLIPIIIGVLALIAFIFVIRGALSGFDFGQNTELIIKIIINTLFTLIVLGVSYCIPQWKYLPTHIGANSLYIYIIHQFIFWQLSIPLINIGFRATAAISGIIALTIGVAIGSAYRAMLNSIYRGLKI